MSLEFNKPPFDHPTYNEIQVGKFDQKPDGTRVPWIPRVFQSKVDGTLAVEMPHRRRTFTIKYVGPIGEQLFHFRGTHLTEEFVRDNAALDFVQLVPEKETPSVERDITWRPDELVPCGNPDKYCGLKGGTVRCGGCRG